MDLPAGGRLRPRVASPELLVNGQGCLPVRGIELGVLPEPHVGVAGAEQRQGSIVARGELVRDLTEIVSRLHPIPGLEVALRQVVLHLGHLGLGGPDLVREPPEEHQRLVELALAEERPGARQIGDGVRRRHHAWAVVAGGRDDGGGDQTEATHGPHGCFGGAGDGASAFPSALIFCCARCVIVSPGVPPVSAC